MLRIKPSLRHARQVFYQLNKTYRPRNQFSRVEKSNQSSKKRMCKQMSHNICKERDKHTEFNGLNFLVTPISWGPASHPDFWHTIPVSKNKVLLSSWTAYISNREFPGAGEMPQVISILVTQAWGPDFRSLHPHKDLALLELTPQNRLALSSEIHLPLPLPPGCWD